MNELLQTRKDFTIKSRHIKMLELKEKNKDPELAIDNAIHEFLRALE